MAHLNNLLDPSMTEPVAPAEDHQIKRANYGWSQK
jgi:hypothetical protein